MPSTRDIPTHERVLLIHSLCGKTAWSTNTIEMIGMSIKNIGVENGSESSEKRAKALREMIEAGITEAEMLNKLKEMEM